jgi:hypothetical protein
MLAKRKRGNISVGRHFIYRLFWAGSKSPSYKVYDFRGGVSARSFSPCLTRGQNHKDKRLSVCNVTSLLLLRG